MQRPEAWPRPHPGEGAAAAPAGGPAPPARGREPAGLRLQEPSLYTIKAVFILDNDGHRLLAKYYDDTFPSMKEQMAFEKNVFNKTSRTDSEIAFFGGMTIVYKSSIDLFLYVVGSSYENEEERGEALVAGEHGRSLSGAGRDCGWRGTRVRALVWEDPTCRGTAGPVSHNY
ncbi:coatomer subunit zeta-2 isoform X8 [Balaenoptera acutorostrata]|uniref:Coatomer subunit zeta n=1 Tax=Balaenoptera acutorostrata TaxID=9767 RepID=A0ABM3SRY3_BALAC|nr:coatomer subunit zeta-2 isoform X8 [Balaenoptera acutorostrata]